MNNIPKSLDDITTTLTRAKLQESDVMPLAQTLYFADIPTHSQHKLLQLDGHLLLSLTENATIRIVGEQNDKAVLCTDSKTYDITNTETSNSLMFVRNLVGSSDVNRDEERGIAKVQVSNIFHDYLEVIPGKLKTDKLNAILKKTEYSGPENEYKLSPDSLFTFDELLQRIQGSRRELEEFLLKQAVITLGGYVRKLDFEYHFRVLSYMLKLVEENSWGIDEIDFEETIDSLKDLVPEDVIKGLFDKYTEDSYESDGKQLYKYKEKEVCQLFAAVILQSAHSFNLDDFTVAWAESVPPGLGVHEAMLEGVACIDRSGVPPHTVSLLTEDMLPEGNLSGRLTLLFGLKQKWTVREITPYILGETTEKMDVNACLAKYARASTVDGIKYYSSKHGK